MTPARREWHLKNRDKERARLRKWYIDNHDKAISNARKWRHDNRERANMIHKKYQHSAKGKSTRTKWWKRYYSLHRLDYRHRKRQWEKEHRQQTTKAVCRRSIIARMELRDWYIRRLLSESTSVPATMWPQNLVNLKREELRLKRIWQPQRALKN